jgi:hypothetical protein
MVTFANSSICGLFYGLRSHSSMMYEEEMEEGDQTVQIPFIMVYISHHKPAYLQRKNTLKGIHGIQPNPRQPVLDGDICKQFYLWFILRPALTI